MAKTPKNSEGKPVLGSRIRLSAEVELDTFVESLSEVLDTPEKLTTFLKLLDTQYAEYDFTLAAAKFYVNEIRQDHLSDGEPFSIEEVFADVLKA